MKVLTSNTDTVSRRPFFCAVCKNDIPAGAYVKRFTFRDDDGHYSKRVCEDCEKYFKKTDPTWESLNV